MRGKPTYTVFVGLLLYFSARPLIVIAGGYDQDQGGMGGFQEWSQVS